MYYYENPYYQQGGYHFQNRDLYAGYRTPEVIFPEDMMYNEYDLEDVQNGPNQPRMTQGQYFTQDFEGGGFTRGFNKFAGGMPSLGGLWGEDAGSVQKGIGAAADVGMNFIPGVGPALSKLGVGSALTNLSYKAFGPEKYEPSQPLRPSGTTTGAWKDYANGGYMYLSTDYLFGPDYDYIVNNVNRKRKAKHNHKRKWNKRNAQNAHK